MIVILIAYTAQTTLPQVNKIQPFAATATDHSSWLLANAAVAKPTVFQVDKTNSKLTWTARKVTGQHTGPDNRGCEQRQADS